MRRLFPLPAMFAAACACGPAPDPDAGPSPCGSNADCEKGMVCQPTGACTNCTSDAQCRPREVCDGKTALCSLRPGWGDDCELNSECAAGEACHQGLCKPQSDLTFCLNPEDPKACPDGFRCNRTNQVCEEDIGCFSDADCRSVEICNLRTHACELRCTPETQATICLAGFKCVDSRCVECTSDAECSPGLTCDLAAGRCTTEGRCFTDRDCTKPLVCNRLTGTCTTAPPPCKSDEDCLPDQKCDVPSGKCMRRACQPDRYEPNNDISTAAVLAPGIYTLLTLCDFEADFYGVKLSRGDHLDITLDTDPLISDAMDVRILDAASRVLAQGNLVADYTVASEGTYYVQVTSTDKFVEYGIRIIISRGIPCDDDIYEPNDGLTQSTQLPQASAQLPPTGTLTICPADVDFYRLSLPSGMSVTFEVFYNPIEGDIDLYAYDSDGSKLLAQSVTTNSPERVTVSNSTSGYVFVRVLSANLRVQNSYYVQVIY